MARILVEARRDTNVKPTLDALAECCTDLGHDVLRWRGPLSGRVPHSRRLRKCDLAIIWNGIHHKYRPFVRRLRDQNIPMLFAELGWFPQKQTFQVDPQGVNAASSWCTDPLAVPAMTAADDAKSDQVYGNGSGDLLVILQDDGDTNIEQFSPWFQDMFSFVTFLAENSVLPLRVRAHPSHEPDQRLTEWLAANPQNIVGAPVIWDSAETLSQSLDDCSALACVNSSSGIEAMYRGVPVLCYGQAVYRHSGVVNCLTNDAQETQSATTQISSGRVSSSAGAIQLFLRRLEQKQWRNEEIPKRLPKLIEAQLSQRVVPEKPTFFHRVFGRSRAA